MHDESGSSLRTPLLIVIGGDYGARAGRRAVVISRCRFTLRGAEYIDACDTAFVQFARILRERADDEIRYEWSDVYRTGLAVEFHINWYDTWFFEQRRDAYRFGPHPFVFQRFGVRADEFDVTHEYVQTPSV